MSAFYSNENSIIASNIALDNGYNTKVQMGRNWKRKVFTVTQQLKNDAATIGGSIDLRLNQSSVRYIKALLPQTEMIQKLELRLIDRYQTLCIQRTICAINRLSFSMPEQ